MEKNKLKGKGLKKRIVSWFLAITMFAAVFSSGVMDVPADAATITVPSNMSEECEPYFFKNSQKADSIVMGGTTYTDVLECTLNGYDGRTSKVGFNLNNQYKTITFYVGHIDGTSINYSGIKMTVYQDSQSVGEYDLNVNDIPKKITCQVDGVNQFEIEITCTNYNYERVYAMGIGGLTFSKESEEVQTYTVSYDANGGSNAPSSQSKLAGSAITLSSSEPTREGYTFKGWSVNSTAATAEYQPGDSYTADASVTLYAVWEKKEEETPQTYTVSYNANGGSNAPSSQSGTQGETIYLSSSEPTRDGYIFKGWSVNSTVTAAEYQPGDSYTVDATVTLYAIWEKEPEKPEEPEVPQEYIIRYDANGGHNAPISHAQTVGTQTNISSSEPSRDGYIFKGWSSTSTATEAEYQPGDSYSADTVSVHTLYAVWKKVCWIHYDADGGYKEPEDMSVEEGTYVQLSETAPVRDGYGCLGWSEYSSATRVTYELGDFYTVKDDVTLYAVWVQNETEPTERCIVRYDANGGHGAPSSQAMADNATTLRLSQTKPKRDGYTFQGWSKSNTSTYVSYQSGATITASDMGTQTELILYAVWNQEKYNWISYDANGGYAEPESQSKSSYSTVTLSSSEPVRYGYQFQGWSADSQSAEAEYQPGDSYGADSDLILYAVWKQNEMKTWTVNYNANGGSNAPANTSVKAADSVEVSLPAAKPTRDGYEFLGWSECSTAVKADWQAGDTYTIDYSKADGTITLYAVWEEIPEEAQTYTIYYNANGGSNAPANQTKKEGEALTLSTMNPTRSGYTFLGWSTSSTATQAQYAPGAKYTADASVTLYAVWQKDAGTTDDGKDNTQSQPVSISRCAISGISASYTYTGSEIRPAVTVQYGKTTLVLNSHYSVSYKNNQDAGTATVTIIGKGNYTGSVNKTFVITKKKQSLKTAKTTYSKTTTSKAFSLKAKVNENAKLTYSSNAPKVAKVNSKGKVTIKGCGNATITIKAAATKNYTSAKKTVKIKVVPPAPAVSVKMSGNDTIRLTWKKIKKISGYEIQVATNTKFKGAKKILISASETKATFVRSKTKNYYFRMRAYKKVNKKKYVSKWKRVNVLKF